MKNLLILSFCFLLLSFNHKSSHWYNTLSYQCRYEVKNGKLDGRFSSYYPNGKKKAMGKLVNNYCSGLWSVWDQNGKLLVQRNYSNPFEFTNVLPTKNKAETTTFKLERDEQGVYKHLKFEEEKVIAAFRFWRLLEPKYNLELFAENRLFNVLKNAANLSQAHAFNNDSLTSLKTNFNFDNKALKITGFKSMEDWVYDKGRQVGEYYTIAICPMGVYENTTDTVELFWMDMNELRQTLVIEKLVQTKSGSSIQNIDDLFFLHGFQSKVVKSYQFETDNTHPSQIFDPQNQLFRIDLEIINNEHDLWVYMLNPLNQ